MYPQEERRKLPDRRQDAITQVMAERIEQLERELEQERYHRRAVEDSEHALVVHLRKMKALADDAYVSYSACHDSECAAALTKLINVELSTTSIDRRDEQLAARVTYEVNRAYCQALGDNSFLPWEEAPEWQKETNMMGVAFHLANPDAGPEASHNSWSAQKLNDGWRYGELKDPSKKTHPCLVAFEALPVAQQAKDYIFRAVVHAILFNGDSG